MRPAACSSRGVPGELQVASGEPLPLTADGRAAWLTAPTGNGVFESRTVPGSSSAWIDAGRVTDPSALTGSTYAIQFSVAAGVTTYSVLKDGAATALTNVPYSAGAAIEIDGVSVSVMRRAGQRRRLRDRAVGAQLVVFDTLDRVIGDWRRRHARGPQIAQGNLLALRDIDSVDGATVRRCAPQIGETLEPHRRRRRPPRGDEAGREHRTFDRRRPRHGARDLGLFRPSKRGYDAALKTYSMVQRLSLFQYLR